MKNTRDFAENEYKARMRVKPDKHQWLRDNYRKLGYISAAALLDEIVGDYIKPNLFKKKGK